MNYRPITASEIPIIAEIQSRAFRFEPARYLEGYAEGGRMGWRELRLLENDAAEPVAALTVFNRQVSLNGRLLDAALIGSVAVLPEQRRRGYGRRMMQGLLEEVYERRTPLSLLFPFSVAWYRSLGYGMANLSWHVDLPLRLAPDFPERLHVRRAWPDDEPAMRACHEQALRLPATNGWLTRTDFEWQKRAFKPEHERAVFVVDGQVEGYLLYKLDWDVVEVVEWVAVSDRAWRGLLAFAGSLGEQSRALKANLPQDSPLVWALREPYDRSSDPVEFVFRRMAQLVNGFMLRPVHLPAALEQRRYPDHVSVEFVLQVDDAQLLANSRPLVVHIDRGAAAVAPAPAGALPSIHTDMATFSQLYAGVMTAEQARTAGKLHGADADCAAVTAAFAAAPWHMWSPDWF